MAKITLDNIVNLQNEASVVSTINNNSDLIEAAIENTLSRDGTSPNQMGANLDMNSNRILNLPVPVSDVEPVRKGEFDAIFDDLDSFGEEIEAEITAHGEVVKGEITNLGSQIVGDAEAARDAALDAKAAAELAETNAETAESNAEQYALDAAQSAAEAEAAADNFDDVYLGSKPSDPTVDNDGDPLVEGQLYWNNVANNLRIYNGSAWVAYSAADGMTALLDDTSPTLGGDLTLNGFDITGTGDITHTGDITTTGSINASGPIRTNTSIQSGAFDADSLDGNGIWIDSSGTSTNTPYTFAAIFQTQRATGRKTQIALSTLSTGERLAYRVQGGGDTWSSWRYSIDTADLGTNVQTFLATPSSANLRAALTDEVGTGAAYFVGGALGTPASGTLTNCTGLPVAGITASTSTALGVGSLNLGHASDTTLSRSAAGKLDVEGHTVLTDDEENQGPITGGASITAKSHGTITTGTLTVDKADCPMQRYTNNGAHTLAMDTGTGSTTLLITNAASAGTITLSGFDIITGDSFTTTNGHMFRCVLERWDGGSTRMIHIQRVA